MRFDHAPALLVALILAAGSASAQVQAPADKPDTEQQADKAAEKRADSGDYWRLMASPYTVHYHKDTNNEHEYVYKQDHSPKSPLIVPIGRLAFIPAR